jgi:uncharacterized protein (TIGR01244 family)
MTNITQLSPKLSVSPQILPTQVAQLAAAGFKTIINNRPDNEAPDQPGSEQIEAEAKRHGLTYWHIPVVAGEMTDEQARTLRKVLDASAGPALAFCRSGARSTNLWKLSEKSR